MDGGGQSTQLSTSAMQRKAIIAKLKASGIAKGKAEDEESSGEDQEYNFEKLKTFHIPRKKEQQDGKDLLTDLPLESREYTHTLYPAIKSSFLYPQSARHMSINKVELVSNQTLLKDFLDKKRDMKDEGRMEKELSEFFAFINCNNKNEVNSICENGLLVGNTGLVSLGKPTMGVYVCKHADLVSSSPLTTADSGFLIVFKVIKGKTKFVTECKGLLTNQEPTPLYDCHVTKLANEGSKGNHSRAYQALQYYLYEYGELDLVNRPRQILPYAVLHYSFVDVERSNLQRDSFLSLLDTAVSDGDQVKKMPTSNRSHGVKTFCLWKGKLLVKGGSFCNVEMRTENDAALNKAFLDNNINVKIFLTAGNFSKQLPPTLLNKSGKKHNVVYRGRNYNIFTLIPAEESGLGKFRQLIAHLVQKKAIAVVPLRMSSCIYLIPNSNLTVNRMGLLPPSSDGDKPNTQFLHALVVTPKLLSTKINEQKNYNLVMVRKRRDPQSEMRVSDDLDQKLRSMNIESASAAGSLAQEQQEKLLEVLKDKKKQQVSDKFLHNHYKEPITFFASKDSYTKFKETLKNLWIKANQSRLDYYKPKENKVPITQPQKSILKSASTPPEQFSPPSKSTKLVHQEAGSELGGEATFSDEDDSDGGGGKPKAYSVRSKSSTLKRSVPLPSAEAEKRKMPLEIDSKGTPPIKMSRPSFKALVEIILSASIDELMIHPDFVFSERFDKTHRVTKGGGFSEVFDVDLVDQIAVQFRQQVPFSTSKDCPYAYADNPVVKSMLRALYGTWEANEGDPEMDEQEKSKVSWVREVLHKSKNLSNIQHTVTSNANDRTVLDETSSNTVKDSSPSVAGSYSADSGFASSSTTTTPNAAAQQTQSSYQDIANLLATAIQGKPAAAGSAGTTAPYETEDAETTPQHIIEAIVKTVNESGLDLPSDLKDIMEELTMTTGGDKVEKNPVSTPVEPSLDPGMVPSSTVLSPPQDATVSVPPAEPSKRSDLTISGLPQDPRLNKAPQLPPRLSLPSYRFPPSVKATELLPKDGEAALNLRPLTAITSSTLGVRGRMMAGSNPNQMSSKPAGANRKTSTFTSTSLLSIPGISIKRKPIASSQIRRTPDFDPMAAGSHPIPTIINSRTGNVSSRNRTHNRTEFPESFKSATSGSVGGSRTTIPITSHVTAMREPTTSEHPSVTKAREESSGIPSTGELTGILRCLGIAPATNRGEQAIQDGPKATPRTLGILRGMQGRTHALRGTTGRRVTKSGGQTILITDDKRVLLDETDISLAPLGPDKPSMIVSNKIPIVISNRPPSADDSPSSSLFLSENFKIVRSNASSSEAQVSSPPAVSTESKSLLSQASGANVRATTLSSATQSTVSSVKKTSGAPVSAGDPLPVPTSSSPIPVLPESYVHQIHEKFKQQQRKRKSNPLTGAVEPSTATAVENLDIPESPTSALAPVSSAATSSHIAQQTDCSAAIVSSQASSSIIHAIETLPLTGVANAVTSTSSSSVSTVASSVVESAPSPGADPPKADVFSEINLILQNAQRGHTSKDDLSARLLELAMQLRQPPTLASGQNEPSGELGVTARMETENTKSERIQSDLDPQKFDALLFENSAHNPDTDLQKSGSVVLKPSISAETPDIDPQKSDCDALKSDLSGQKSDSEPQQSDSGSNALTSRSESQTDSDRQRNESDAPKPNLGNQASDSGPQKSDFEPPKPGSNDARNSKSDPQRLGSNADIRPTPHSQPAPDESSLTDEQLASERDTHTPTQDDSFDSNLHKKVTESFAKSYKHLTPISGVARSMVKLDNNVRSLLERVRKGIVDEIPPKVPDPQTAPHVKPSKARPTAPKLQNRLIPATPGVPAPTEQEKPSKVRAVLPRQQKVAHVKPYSKSSLPRPSFYVFNPRNDAECNRIAAFLGASGRPFPMHNIASAIAKFSTGSDGVLVPLTKSMIDSALEDNILWIVIRSADVELMPALPHLSLLKCAGPKVNFVKAESAEDVAARKYSNIMAGEFGIIMPVSVQVLTDNRVAFVGLLAWMLNLNKKNNKPYWRMALPKHIARQLTSFRDGAGVTDALKIASLSLLEVIEQHRSVIVDAVVTDERSESVSTTEVFDALISLQMQHVDFTRHLIVLTENDSLPEQWNTHRRAGIAVTTVERFIDAIMNQKKKLLDEQEENVYSPLAAIYQVEK